MQVSVFEVKENRSNNRWKDGLDVSALRCHAVTEFPTANGPADYALFVNGKLLGIPGGEEGYHQPAKRSGASQAVFSRSE